MPRLWWRKWHTDSSSGAWRHVSHLWQTSYLPTVHSAPSRAPTRPRHRHGQVKFLEVLSSFLCSSPTTYALLPPNAPCSHWFLPHHPPSRLPLLMSSPWRMPREAHLLWPAFVEQYSYRSPGCVGYRSWTFIFLLYSLFSPMPSEIYMPCLFSVSPFGHYTHQHLFMNLCIHAVKCSNKHLDIADFLCISIHPSIRYLFIHKFILFSSMQVCAIVFITSLFMLAFVFFLMFECIHWCLHSFMIPSIHFISYSSIMDYCILSCIYAFKHSCLHKAFLYTHIHYALFTFIFSCTNKAQILFS